MKKISLRFQILRFVTEQGIVTVDDIKNRFNCKKESVRVIMSQLGINHYKYGDIQHGLWFIGDQKLFGLLRTYYPDLPRFKVRGLSLLVKAPHSLGINHIRIVLENSKKIRIVKWWSEEYLRALPVFSRDGISMHKIPDAIFWHLRKDGTNQKFFLEYERSLKAPKRYSQIFQFYDKRHDVKNNNVIYICETDFIKRKLERIESDLVKGGKLKGSGVNFNFVTLEEFDKAYALSEKKTNGEWSCR